MELYPVKRVILCLFGWLFALSIAAQADDLPVVRLLDNDYYRYEVKKSETIFSLCRRFQVTEEELMKVNPTLIEGLKAGQQLLIPIKPNQKQETTENQEVAAENKQETLPRITVLLPFNLTEASALNERYLEFYEGFLLAVDTLKSMGLSFEVQALNVGTDAASVEQLIESGKLDQTDYCVGGINAAQIAVLSRWAASSKKTTILPFSSRIPEMAANSYLFQPMASQEHMLGRLATYLSIRFAGVDYILLKDPTRTVTSKSESLTEALKAQFAKTGTRYREVFPDDILNAKISTLSSIHESVIVPYPMSQNDANRFVTSLAAATASMPEKKIALLGYPEWQAMNKRSIQLLHSLNTYLFSGFYANFQEESVSNFQQSFASTYGKTMLNTYPRYGIMGYDIASYFIPKMVNARKGHAITNGPEPLQQTFQFQPSASGSGSFNQPFYLINFKKDNQIDVKQIR